jgi:KTSC domain-containing protein
MTEVFYRPHSSNVARVEYEDQVSEMIVTFKSGASYVVRNVDQGLFERFKAAGSAGKFYNESVKDAGYEIERM